MSDVEDDYADDDELPIRESLGPAQKKKKLTKSRKKVQHKLLNITNEVLQYNQRTYSILFQW